MAETPDLVPEALTEYERRRQENIRRNQAILAELRRDAAAVSAAYAPARPKKQPRTNPAGPAAAPRRSGRSRRQPPPLGASTADSLPSAHLKRRPARFPISEAFVGEAATAADPSAPLTSAIRAASWRPPPEGNVVRVADGLDPRNPVLQLKPGNVRKLTPTVISAAPRVLPLVDRTVVAVGTDFGHLVLWDADSMVPVRPPLCARSDGMFWYHPHSQALSGITAHPFAPMKVMTTFLLCSVTLAVGTYCYR
jgi:hypothetical protein